jgi:hypothetical protein
MNLWNRGIVVNTLRAAVLALAGACAAHAQQPGTVTASIPYVVFGGVVTPTYVNAWSTEFMFTNLGSTTATLGLRWFGDNGQPLAVPVLGGTRSTTQVYQIAPGATIDISLDDTQDPLTDGWAAVDITGLVNGQAVLHFDLTGRPEYTAAAPLLRQGAPSAYVLLGGGTPVTTVNVPISLALPFNNVNNVTGVSFANITTVAQILTLNYLDDTGALLMSQAIPLGPGAHTAFALTDPRVAGTKGSVVVSGDGSPYSAIAFVVGAGANSGTFATLLPVIQ